VFLNQSLEIGFPKKYDNALKIRRVLHVSLLRRGIHVNVGYAPTDKNEIDGWPIQTRRWFEWVVRMHHGPSLIFGYRPLYLFQLQAITMRAAPSRTRALVTSNAVLPEK
jgi:hypothetical protein